MVEGEDLKGIEGIQSENAAKNLHNSVKNVTQLLSVPWLLSLTER